MLLLKPRILAVVLGTALLAVFPSCSDDEGKRQPGPNNAADGAVDARREAGATGGTGGNDASVRDASPDTRGDAAETGSGGGRDAAPDAQPDTPSTDAFPDVDAGDAGDACAVTSAKVGDPCSDDCQCAGMQGGLVGICSNHAYRTGSNTPTPVCMSLTGASALYGGRAAPCDDGRGTAVGGVAGAGACYPGCTIDANGAHGCIGKNICMYLGFSDSPALVARGICWGGCKSDADCTGGDTCQLDLGYCRNPSGRYTVTKPLGASCTFSDSPVACNCDGRSEARAGYTCTQVCEFGKNSCPTGYSCDAGVPTTDPATGAALFSTIGSAGVWGNCVRNCTVDADCGGLTGPRGNSVCVLHAGMGVQKTCGWPIL